MDIGKRIVQLREERGITTNRLANLCGISQSFLRNVELGEKGISVNNLHLVCEALGVSMVEFFSVCEKPEKDDNDLAGIVDRLSGQQKRLLADFLKELLSRRCE